MAILGFSPKIFFFFDLVTSETFWGQTISLSDLTAVSNISWRCQLMRYCLLLFVSGHFLYSFWKFYEMMSERGGFLIDTDCGPLGYIVWCCDSRSQDFFTLICRLALTILCVMGVGRHGIVALQNIHALWIRVVTVVEIQVSILWTTEAYDSIFLEYYNKSFGFLSSDVNLE